MAAEPGPALEVALAPGLRALGAALPIARPLPWLPAGVRGYEPCFVYLFEGPSRTLLIDTGLPVHREIILSALRRRLPPGRPLSIVATRPEPDCLGNIGAIVDTFPVEEIAGFSLNPLEFFPASFARRGAAVAFTRRRLGESWTWDAGRSVQFLPAPLGLLVTAWPYDPATGCLCTSDTFGWVHLRARGDPCCLDAASPLATPAAVDAHLRRRFHWLPHCRPGLVEAALRRVFEAGPVRLIAPTHGCVFRGPGAVGQQYALLRDAVARAPAAAGAAASPDAAAPWR